MGEVLGLPIRSPRRQVPLGLHQPLGWSGRPRRTLLSAEVGGRCKVKGACSSGVRECRVDFSSNLGGRCRGANRCNSRDFKEAWDQEGSANPGSLWRSSSLYSSSSGGPCHSNNNNSNKGLVCSSSNSPRCSGGQGSPGCNSSGGHKWRAPRELSLVAACSRGDLEVREGSELGEEGCSNREGLCSKEGLAVCSHSSSRCRISSLADSTSPGCNRVSSSSCSSNHSSRRSHSLTGVGWWLDPGRSSQTSLVGAMRQFLLLHQRHPLKSTSTGEAGLAGWTIPLPLEALEPHLSPEVLELHLLAVVQGRVVVE